MNTKWIKLWAFSSQTGDTYFVSRTEPDVLRVSPPREAPYTRWRRTATMVPIIRPWYPLQGGSEIRELLDLRAGELCTVWLHPTTDREAPVKISRKALYLYGAQERAVICKYWLRVLRIPLYAPAHWTYYFHVEVGATRWKPV